MRQTSTDHRKEHRPNPTAPGQQFALDAFSNTYKSSRGNKYCDLLTDLATGQIHPVFTKDRSAPELISKAKVLFNMHPRWRIPSPTVVRFVRLDPESNYNSQDFLSCLSTFGYEVERSPPRDKHANGVAERTVGLVTAKANTAMLAPTPPVPQRFWDLAMAYACHTMSFNYNSRIQDSPYHYIHGQHVDIKLLHPFWSICYVYIPLKHREGKLGSPRAYIAHFVGYNFSTIMFPNYLVIEQLPKGRYSQIRSSKDVIFDSSVNFVDNQTLPTEEDFRPTVPHPPTTPLVSKPVVKPLPIYPKRVTFAPDPSTTSTISSKRVNTRPIDYKPEEPDAVYWYSIFVDTHEYPLRQVETSHFSLAVKIKHPNVPKSFWEAMKLPEWEAAINKERGKFEINNCLEEVPYINQHLVPMMWLFNIKTDGTKKARLVGRGDMMIPWIDFDPNAVYCGNVSASSIKIALIIAAQYKLIMRGGDLVGAYLVTLANPDYPVFIKTPQGYHIEKGNCIRAVGNLYGFPPAGQNFSKEFDKCVTQCGYKNTPWDPKLFHKWKDDKPLIIIAHSDDFRWFGPDNMLHEWDLLIKTFGEHKYEVTDATDKEFVGIRISRDKDFNYYMDQERILYHLRG